MEVMFKCCAGLDVHKRIIVACALVSSAEGVQRHLKPGRRRWQVWRRWRLRAGLGVTHVAMESTGVYGSRCSTCWPRCLRCGLSMRVTSSARAQDGCQRCRMDRPTDALGPPEAQLHPGSCAA